MTKFGTTEIEIGQRCEWKWDKMSFNREGLTPIVHKPYLDLGSLVHVSLYNWKLDPKADLPTIFDHHAAIKMLEIAQNYREAVGAPISQSELAPFTEATYIGHRMMENYQAQWVTPLPPGWKLISAEQTCLVTIPGTYHPCYAMDVSEPCFCKDCTFPKTCCSTSKLPPIAGNECICCCWHQLEGTLDGLAANERGDNWVIEIKTWNNHPREDFLKFTPQFARYVWITRQLPPLSAVGIAYDGLWSRAEVPKGKKFEDLFLRKPILINDHFVDQIGEHTAKIALRLGQLKSEDCIKTIDWTCPQCGVYELCQADAYDEDYEYYLHSRYKKRPLTPAYERPDDDS